MATVKRRQSLILELDVRGKTVIGLRLRGIEIEDFYLPRLMSDAEQIALPDRFWQ